VPFACALLIAGNSGDPMVTEQRAPIVTASFAVRADASGGRPPFWTVSYFR
jgi:hypothetical protein